MNGESKSIVDYSEAEKTKEIVKKEPMPLQNSLEIKNLIVSSAPLRILALGEVKDIVDITGRKQNQVDSIIWNEKEIKLILKDDNTQISFLPEFHPSSEMFFHREEKRNSRWDDEPGLRIWEGEYEPIQFGKSKLIKFLKKYAEYFEPEVEQAIKNMRVTHKKSEDSEMLSLDDDDNVRTVLEETKTTNIPRNFKALMPLFGGYSIELDFEAAVVKKTDSYGREKNQNAIQLRCTNAREAIRQVMQEIISQFPKEIPKYYGKTRVDIGKN